MVQYQNKGIPKTSPIKKVESTTREAASLAAYMGLGGKKTRRKKEATPVQNNRRDEEFRVLCNAVEGYFIKCIGTQYPVLPFESFRVNNIVKAAKEDIPLLKHLCVVFTKDWNAVQSYYPALNLCKTPTWEALDLVKYQLMVEVLAGGNRYENYSLFRESSTLPPITWSDELNLLADSEREKSTKIQLHTSAKRNTHTLADGIDVSLTKYAQEPVSAYTLTNTQFTASGHLARNYLESPPEHIKHGYDMKAIKVELKRPAISLDLKGNVLLPIHSINVNGPGENPILSKYFGYVPDGKYRDCHFESPEAFTLHRRVCAESLVFFNAVPDIYSRAIHTGTEAVRPVGERQNHSKEYDILEGIAHGLPRIGYLTAMITDMGFSSWEQYWDWYYAQYENLIFRMFRRATFNARCHGIQPSYVYSFPKYRFLGLNPEERILDKPFVPVLHWTEPPRKSFRRLQDDTYKYTNTHLV